MEWTCTELCLGVSCVPLGHMLITLAMAFARPMCFSFVPTNLNEHFTCLAHAHANSCCCWKHVHLCMFVQCKPESIYSWGLCTIIGQLTLALAHLSLTLICHFHSFLTYAHCWLMLIWVLALLPRSVSIHCGEVPCLERLRWQPREPIHQRLDPDRHQHLLVQFQHHFKLPDVFWVHGTLQPRQGNCVQICTGHIPQLVYCIGPCLQRMNRKHM